MNTEIGKIGSLHDCLKYRYTIAERLQILKRQHNEMYEALESELKKLDEQEKLLLAGFDAVKISRAKEVVFVQGFVTHHVNSSDRMDRRNVRPKALEDAMQDLVSAFGKIDTHYFGVKNYDGFGDQREDHQYGQGPRHGNIVFSIGKQKDFRKTELTAAQMDDVLYYLSQLKYIERNTTNPPDEPA